MYLLGLIYLTETYNELLPSLSNMHLLYIIDLCFEHVLLISML